jgi:hypothetical protein
MIRSQGLWRHWLGNKGRRRAGRLRSDVAASPRFFRQLLVLLLLLEDLVD